METRKKQKIDDLIKKLELPSSTIFLGFAVHHIERDEFLHTYQIKKDSFKRTWSNTPEMTKKYKSQLDAEKVAKEIDNGCIAVALFDVESQILVSGL